MAAGDFTASTLYNVQRRLTDVFSGSRFQYHLNTPFPSLNAALTRQTATFDPIQTSTRQTRGVEVSFLKAASIINDATTVPVTSCTIGGDEMESAKITIIPTEDLWFEFTVWDQDVNDIYSFEDKVAEGFAVNIAKLRTTWNNKVLAWFNANTMLPVIHTTDGILAGNVITVPIATFNTAEYLATMMAIAEENNLYNAYVISARMFYIAKYAAQFKSAACCNVDALYTEGPFDLVFDLKNLDAIVGTNAALLIDPSSYAIWPHNNFLNDIPIPEAENKVVWRQADPFLQFSDGGVLKPVYYDVIAERKCRINQDEMNAPDSERFGTSFRLHARWGKTLAPDPAGIGTGIIEFNAV